MAYNFQKYSLDRIQYLGAPYDTGEFCETKAEKLGPRGDE